MLKPSHKKYLICALIFLSVGFFMHVHAQIVISKPNLSFTQACANPDFNTYNVSFVFSPESSLDTSNQFVLELSDPEGDFTNSTVVYTSTAGAITASPATLTFSLPEDTAGENYKLRVKSTAPAANSSASDAFAAYYKLHDTPFT